MTRGSLLIGDLGGTNARFALVRADDIDAYSDQLTLQSRDYDLPERAIEAYLEKTSTGNPGAICLAVAGPVKGNTVSFLNIDWQLDANDLARRFAGVPVRLVNDFQAIAHAIPFLAPGDVKAIGSPQPRLQREGVFTAGVIGPGTGLGVSGVMRVAGRVHSLASEGGHVGFAPATELQMAVLQRLRQVFDRVSDERIVSGPGIENIYHALRDIYGLEPIEIDAAGIFELARGGEDEIALKAERLFFEALGQVAGNLALTLGAHDGIYLAGGIVHRHADRLQSGPFRSGFENKGRHRAMMERIPTCLITHPQPGLLGAAALARNGESR